MENSQGYRQERRGYNEQSNWDRGSHRGEHGYGNQRGNRYHDSGRYDQQQNYYEDRRHNQRSFRGSEESSTQRQDKYHWSRENRFSSLQNEPEQNNEVEAIPNTIKTDIKSWAESKMWPFSCYSYTKGAKCIDGLPDISPEELRVLAYLHPSTYRDIVGEIESTYIKRKDELYEMSEQTKANIQSFLRSPVDSSPSGELKIAVLYGPQFSFLKENPDAADSASNPPTQQSNVLLPSPPYASGAFGAETSTSEPPMPSFSFKTQDTTPQSSSNIFGAATSSPDGSRTPKDSKSVMSVFGSSFGDQTPSAKTEIYTSEDLLTETEKQQFLNDRFTIGQIPTRPPPKAYC